MPQYFTPDTDRHIKLFIEATEMPEKHRLFEAGIRMAFEKLIESIIHVYRFHFIDNVDTLKRECLANLYEMIHKFDPNRGKKGFSYFNVVTRNWFIQKIREKKKRAKLASELYYDLDHENVKNDPNFSLSPHEDQIVDKEFWVSLFSQMDLWKERLVKPNERKVLDAIIFLLQNSALASMHNKKAVFVYLRELTGLSTKQIVIHLKKFKGMYDEFKVEFDNTGEMLS